MLFVSCLIAAVCLQGAFALPIKEEQNAWELSGKFEGDITFPEGRNGLLDETRYWPDSVLVYEIASGFDADQVAAIEAAFADYAANTCVSMRPRETADRNYVHIQGSASGCYSNVGLTGGRQVLNLQYNTPGSGCFRHGTVMHELLHSLGFYHQQSATDRDEFVTIHFENIQAGTENNFNKYPATVITDFGVTYDYGSVMHYSELAFSSNGLPTIVPTDPNATIGQRVGLSPSDILKLNSMYPCKK